MRCQIRRQQNVLATLEGKHKLKFPSAIHKSDQGGHLRRVCYGDDDTLTGVEVIRFRQAIAGWLVHYAAEQVNQLGNTHQ